MAAEIPVSAQIRARIEELDARVERLEQAVAVATVDALEGTTKGADKKLASAREDLALARREIAELENALPVALGREAEAERKRLRQLGRVSLLQIKELATERTAIARRLDAALAGVVKTMQEMEDNAGRIARAAYDAETRGVLDRANFRRHESAYPAVLFERPFVGVDFHVFGYARTKWPFERSTSEVVSDRNSGFTYEQLAEASASELCAEIDAVIDSIDRD